MPAQRASVLFTRANFVPSAASPHLRLGTVHSAEQVAKEGVIGATSHSFDDIGTLVRAIMRRKSGQSLRADDTRSDNVDVLDLCHDVIARLWEHHVQRGGDAKAAAWHDFSAYAATVTHNAWSDHLRQKYPKRTSLKNRLRYFLGHQPRYALWEGAHGEPTTGLHAWLLRGLPVVADARVQALRDGRECLPAGSVPRRAFERFTATDWDHLLGAIFRLLEAPVMLDSLVGLVAALIDLHEDHVESIDDAAAEIDASRHGKGLAADDPERVVETRDMLRELWHAVCALKVDYRRAYLLNLPGPGKLRGDIDVFVMNGIASIEEIFRTLDLSDTQLAMALDNSTLSETEHVALGQCRDAAERFYVLWAHLPLGDALIAQLLGLAQQQVINRRMLALRELARLLRHARPVGRSNVDRDCRQKASARPESGRRD